MKKRLAIVLILIVLLPLIAIAILGIKVARDDRQLMTQQYRRMVDSELAGTLALIETALGQRTRQFEKLCSQRSPSPNVLRDATDAEPFVRQFFIVNKEGKLAYPVNDNNASEAEQAFLKRTAHLWTQRFPFRSSNEKTMPNTGSGFHTYYWNRGLQFVFWAGHQSGQVIGFEVEKTMLLADLIDVLPQTDLQGISDKRVRLTSENGKTLYQYGGFSPAARTAPISEQALPPPFGSWRLQYFAPQQLKSTGLATSTISTLMLIGILLLVVLALGAYFLLAYNRESQLAMQQVNFVNQVSHELKTPLTNIRMYAELLADQLDQDDDIQQRYIRNVTTESQRLSRLIQNVLSFAGSNRNRLVLRPSEGCLDDVITASLAPFRPALDRLSIAVETDLNAAELVIFDTDLVGQVLTNLISNVEKYASSGQRLRIQSNLNGTHARIRVEDNGPGIAPHQRQKIFLPFNRLENQITEGATGTGIGLTISRSLARLHGGDLCVLNSTMGALFEFQFSVKRIMP
ncbi:MAG: HAMP domain-containing histidine kinase [Deltaproteobacteria bacterium]|nr:HAMP domain-containing histidine kinase [Deltaproteobacteria bacterium]